MKPLFLAAAATAIATAFAVPVFADDLPTPLDMLGFYQPASTAPFWLERNTILAEALAAQRHSAALVAYRVDPWNGFGTGEHDVGVIRIVATQPAIIQH